MRKTITFLKSMLLMLIMLVVGNGFVLGQGTLSNPIFQENFGSLANATALTTSNTAFNYVRVGSSTNGTPLNQIVASNPGTFSGSSGLISAKGGSISTVDKTGLSSFSRGTYTFKFKTPSTLTSAVLVSAVGTGSSFGSYSGFNGAHLSAAFQVTGTNLQIRAAGAWTTVQTVAVNTSYEICVVFNNTAGSLSYGDSKTLPSNKCHVWINGTYVNEYSTGTAGLAASAFRIYTTTSQFEVDDIAVYNSLPASPAPTTQASGINFTSVSQTGMTINWSNGNGTSRAVFVKETSGIITNPVDGTTYTASTNWSSKGTQLGTSGYYCVYNGTETSVALTNLASNTSYSVQVFEYNGTGATSKYYTATATNNPNSQATAAASCTTPTYSFSTPTSVSKHTSDVAFTNSFTSDNTSTKVWTSTNEAVATVDVNGLVTIHSAGTTNIRVNQVADATYCAVVDASYSLTVNIPEPTNHAASFTATTNSTSQITITWTDATGAQVPDGYLVKASTGTPTAPADGTAEADAILVKNIAQGTQTAVFTGLSASTTYNFSVWPYTNSGTAIDYKIGSEPTASATTADVQLGLQISSANTVYKIDFDNTVGNVNNGKFLGASSNPSPAAGALNSDAFSFDVSSSTSNSTFGSSHVGGGVSTGGVSNSATFYAFTVSSGNNSLGIQPTGSNYTPGNVTLRFQNKTGSPITQLLVSYKVYILNNEARSNFIKLQHGDNTAAYNFVSALDLTSTANADGSPAWKVYFRSAKLTGLNIANNSNYCVRWTMDDVGGSTNRDEFALDDIEIVANPVSNNPEIGGTMEEAIIDGNVTILENTTVNSTLNITSNGILTVPASKQLTLGSSFVNNGTLLLKSDATGTATLLDSYATPTVAATVQQHVTSGRNWYVSAPVSGAAYSTLDKGNSIVEWSEGSKGWVAVSSGTLTPGKGYIQVASSGQGSTGTVNFSGTTNSGDVTVSLTRSGTTQAGFNLVGNPYPSYLDWEAVAAANTDVLPTAWFRTKKADNSYVFATVNVADVTPVIVNNGANTTVTSYIPPMQAYWVRVDAGKASTNYTVSNSMRHHADDNGNKLKAPKSNSQQLLRLNVTGAGGSDEAVVYFSPKATNSLDRYDSPKMSNNNVAIPEIYTLAGAEKLVINGMGELSPSVELPLGFTTGQTNNFTISALELKNFASDIQVILKDKLQNTEFDLTSGQAYGFNSGVVNDASRFSIIFKTAGSVTGLDNKKLDTNTSIFVNANGELVVKTSALLGANANVAVFNAIGQQISSKPMTSDMTISNVARTAGVYWVKLTNDGESITRKVVVK